MKTLLFIILSISFVVSNAQVVFYPINDVGFGKSSEVSELMPWVVNGPLFDGSYNIIGGYIDNGVQKKPWVNPMPYGGNFSVRNGIIGMTKAGEMILISYEELNSLPYMQWAFQNGPILVRDGKNLSNPQSDSKCTRSGIGFKTNGDLVVVIDTIPCTPWELAEQLRQLGCNNAMYLDGLSPTGYATQNGVWGLKPEAMKIQFFKNPNK